MKELGRRKLVWSAHVLLILLLSIITQTGGIIWLMVWGFFSLIKQRFPAYIKLLFYLLIYVLSAFIVIPPLAELSGKVQLPVSKKGSLIPHNILYPLMNRNYVTPIMYDVLLQTAHQLQQRNADMKLVYLNASFPFSIDFSTFPKNDGKDGKKVDLCFAYRKNDKLMHSGSSISGYGNFELPTSEEIDVPAQCKKEGFRGYDYRKYLTLGKKQSYTFDDVHTRAMIMALLAHPYTELIYLEPHLIQRLEISDLKMKYAGCQTARHDDHLHYQIR